MFLRLIAVQVMAFVIILFLSKVIMGLLQNYLLGEKYKLTTKFSYIITCLIIILLGIGLGKEFLYIFL
jgi:hypothetical protein